MARGKTYDDTTKDNAVGVAAEKGLAEASRELDIPKSTIKTWAKARGVDVADEKVQAQIERATTMSVATRQQKIAEAKERAAVLFAAIVELGAHAQIDLLKSGQFTLSEAVGATTRALHDLQLLEGNPTEITEDITAEGVARLRDEIQSRITGEQQ